MTDQEEMVPNELLLQSIFQPKTQREELVLTDFEPTEPSTARKVS